MSAVPPRLWVKLVFGQWLMQMGAVIVGVCSVLLAFVLPHGPEDPPIWLASFILALGCFPLFAVALLRAHRTLRLMRYGREVTTRRVGKQVEIELPDGAVHKVVIENPASTVIYDPENPTLVANPADLAVPVPGAVVWLALVLPLAAIAGIVILVVV